MGSIGARENNTQTATATVVTVQAVSRRNILPEISSINGLDDETKESITRLINDLSEGKRLGRYDYNVQIGTTNYNGPTLWEAKKFDDAEVIAQTKAALKAKGVKNVRVGLSSSKIGKGLYVNYLDIKPTSKFVFK